MNFTNFNLFYKLLDKACCKHKFISRLLRGHRHIKIKATLVGKDNSTVLCKVLEQTHGLRNEDFFRRYRWTTPKLHMNVGDDSLYCTYTTWGPYVHFRYISLSNARCDFDEPFKVSLYDFNRIKRLVEAYNEYFK